MGDFISNPSTKVFIGIVAKTHQRREKEIFDTVVLRVDKVLRGPIKGKHVGIILRSDEASILPIDGTRVLVLTGSAKSPYLPVAHDLGFAPLNQTNYATLISCAQSSLDFVNSPDQAGRINAMRRLRQLATPCDGGAVVKSLVDKFCGAGDSDLARRQCIADHQPGMTLPGLL